MLRNCETSEWIIVIVFPLYADQEKAQSKSNSSEIPTWTQELRVKNLLQTLLESL